MRPARPRLRGLASGRLKIGGQLDRYVIRLFAFSYLTAFLLVVGLFLIIDVAASLDTFVAPDDEGRSPSSLTILAYYASHVPFIYFHTSIFVTLVGGLFTTTHLDHPGDAAPHHHFDRS